MLYVVEERGIFFRRFIAFSILLIVTKGGLYQGQLYYTNIILEETITLLVHYTYNNALPMFWGICSCMHVFLMKWNPIKEDQKLSILDSYAK